MGTTKDSDTFIFKETGECQIILEKLIKAWNYKWFISEHNGKFTLCKRNLKAGNFTKLSVKVEISENDAIKIIDRIGLRQTKSSVFRSASTWRHEIGDF